MWEVSSFDGLIENPIIGHCRPDRLPNQPKASILSCTATKT
jgi:hypothetical protein